jgi:hypothetical protein
MEYFKDRCVYVQLNATAGLRKRGIMRRAFFKWSFWNHHLRDALSAPAHILALAAGIAAVGGLRSRIDFDLFERRPYAFGVLKAADIAKRCKIDTITVFEFGVASGVGLRSLSRIAAAVQEITNVTIEVVGFDTGFGMPPAEDYRDHPEHYFQGDFAPPTQPLDLPSNCRLIVGAIRDTVPKFLREFSGTIGFVSVDVDYYSSTKDCLEIFKSEPARYLPTVPTFFDDVLLDSHNEWCGERLAINEFNQTQNLRKIAHYTALRTTRIFKNANWIEQMYAVHVLDHRTRQVEANRPAIRRVM